MSPSRSTTRIRISLASGAGSQSSPIGLIGAIALHLAVIVVTLFTWEHRLDIVQESPPVVPVDLVTIAQKTNIAPTIRLQPKIEPEKIQQPPAPDIIPQTPPLPQAEPAPAPDVKPQPAPKPQPEKDKLADILKQLTTQQPDKKPTKDKLADVLKQWAAPTAQPQQQQHGKIAAQTRRGFADMNAMTMDLADALRNQIEQRGCWDKGAFSGAPHPEQLIVYVELSLNPDGSVARAPQLAAQSAGAAASNPFMRAAADAAFRAIMVCAPFKLPADRYAEWRDSTIKFDPRDLAGN